jgi:hypothetical protein
MLHSRTHPPLLPFLPLCTPGTSQRTPLSLLNLPLLAPRDIRIHLFDAQHNVLEVLARLGYALSFSLSI